VAFTAEIASKLRWNMISNALMALVLVLFLFWLAFRNLYPLFAIGATLVMAVLVNVVLTGLIFGGFNVITGSFAAILVGLGDYGILIYNRYSLAMNSAGPGSDARSDEATKEAAILYTARCTVPGILLGASTTAAAFLCTSWTSSPGFRQFGVVVAMGVAVCAVLMIVFYFSLIAGPTPRGVESDVFGRLLRPLGEAVATHARAVRIGSLLAILAALLVVLGGSRPGVGFDADPQSLRFRHSPASTTLDKVLTRLDRTANPCVLLISGSDWGEVAETTGQLRARLEQAKANGIVHLFESPSALLPPLSQQRENARRLALLDWPAIRDAFQQALVAEGFRPDQFQSTVAWLQAAERYGAAPEPVLLTPSQWLEHGGESSLVLGRYVYSGTGVVQTATYVYPTKPLDSVGAIESLSAQLGVDDDRVRLTNWDALILEMQPLFRRDFLRISLVVFVVVVVIIWSGYRRFKPLGLLAIPVAGAVAGILAVMKVCGIKFNLANFFAVPIVIGAGVDYAIHMFNGVEEEGGDGKAAIRVTGKAVVVNALTTMIGFGSLMMTDHTGLATLGLLTTLGIFFCLIFSVVALP
jgi:predicted RND superfamily exporter protein